MDHVRIHDADDEAAPRQQAGGFVLAVAEQVGEANRAGSGLGVHDAFAGAGRVLLTPVDHLFDQLRERRCVDDDRVVVEERRRVSKAVIVDGRAGEREAE